MGTSRIRPHIALATLGLLLCGCGDSSEEGAWASDGAMNVNVAYATRSTAITIGDIPEGEKDYMNIQVFRGSDVIGSDSYSTPYPIFSETYGAEQRQVEIDGLPVGEVLIVEVTTYDFTGQPTFVGKAQKTLTEGRMSDVQISMKQFGIFLKNLVTPVAKASPYGYGRDRVEFRYSIENNTLEDLDGLDIDVDSLTSGVSGSADDSVYTTFKPFTTKTTDGSFTPYVEIPDGYRGEITLRVTFTYYDYSDGDISMSQTVTFTPDYSGL